MKIFIGADHRGVPVKEKINSLLAQWGHQVTDVGTHDENESCDYPQIGFDVAKHVSQDSESRGILVCMSGIGQTIVANKVPGIRAALCYNEEAAMLSRQHNNANVLVLGAKFVTAQQIEDIIKTWLSAEFEGGRHERRVNQIQEIEKEISGS